MKLIALLCLFFGGLLTVSGDVIRVGMIGLDTSHVVAFTETINNPKAKGHVPGAKVIAAFKGGSPDIESSASRVDGFTKTLQEKYGVNIYDSIDELCQNVDAVMIESVDGRPHLEQARIVIAAKKPLYLDKPMAGSLKDVLEIFRLARAAKVPVFSSSSLRYGKATQAVRNGSIGKVHFAQTTSPAKIEKTHPDLFWYGVHGCEALFTVMGTGCESVVRGVDENGMIKVTGTWQGGRTGVFLEGKGYSGFAKGEKGEAKVGGAMAISRSLLRSFSFSKAENHLCQPKKPLSFSLSWKRSMKASDGEENRLGFQRCCKKRVRRIRELADER